MHPSKARKCTQRRTYYTSVSEIQMNDLVPCHGPVYRESAPVHQHQDRRLADGIDLLQQFLLRCRQINTSAVSSRESLGMDVHLFALDPRRETSTMMTRSAFRAASSESCPCHAG